MTCGSFSSEGGQASSAELWPHALIPDKSGPLSKNQAEKDAPAPFLIIHKKLNHQRSVIFRICQRNVTNSSLRREFDCIVFSHG
jgi:hypothetical protein